MEEAKEKESLEVRPSKIPKAGKGLFATKTFARGDYICPVVGRWLHKASDQRRTLSPYEFEFPPPGCKGNRGKCLMYQMLPTLAMYINDNKVLVNCVLSRDGHLVCAIVRCMHVGLLQLQVRS